jgi:hypothetical protein
LGKRQNQVRGNYKSSLKRVTLNGKSKREFPKAVADGKASNGRRKKSIRSARTVFLQQTIEVTAVAIGAQKLLAQGRGELHNSGNWAGGLKSTEEEGGKLNLENFKENRRVEKRAHRPDIARLENQINTGMHTHIYIPESGPVILPEMSRDEANKKNREDIVRQWDAIPAANTTQLEEIRMKLSGGKLTKWLEENCQGKLINKATENVLS